MMILNYIKATFYIPSKGANNQAGTNNDRRAHRAGGSVSP